MKQVLLSFQKLKGTKPRNNHGQCNSALNQLHMKKLKRHGFLCFPLFFRTFVAYLREPLGRIGMRRERGTEKEGGVAKVRRCEEIVGSGVRTRNRRRVRSWDWNAISTSFSHFTREKLDDSTV